MKVKNSMSCRPYTVSPNDTLVHARELMCRGKFRHLVVVSDGVVTGILSAHDIAEHQSRTGESIFSNPTDAVWMAMTEAAETIEPNDELREASRRLAASKLGCLPVVEHGDLVGILTTTDVLAAIACPEVPQDQGAGPKGMGPKVVDAMTRSPKTINAYNSLLDAVARMQQYQIRHLPVVDGEQVVVGMLSDRDLRTAFGNPREALSKSTSFDEQILVRDWMSSPVLTVASTDDCVSSARLFATRSIGALPVLDEQERLIGILSYVDVLRALATYAQEFP